MAIIPDYGTQRGGFFKNLKGDIKKLSEPDDDAPLSAGNAANTCKDGKDALGTKDYAECVKNLNLALMTMEPPAATRINAPIELKGEETPEPAPDKENTPEPAPEEDMSYFFIGDDSEDFEISPEDYDETLLLDLEPLEYKEEPIPEPKEMPFEDFLAETEGGEFDILPVLYNLNYSSNGAFMPEKIDKVILPHPKRGDQIVFYAKDGKRAFVDFVTGRRIVQTPDEDRNYKTALIDDDGYRLQEDTYFNYSREKKFQQ